MDAQLVWGCCARREGMSAWDRKSAEASKAAVALQNEVVGEKVKGILKESVLRETHVPDEYVESVQLSAASLSLPRAEDVEGVPGLIYVPGFVDAAEQEELLSLLDEGAGWDVKTFEGRHMIHYGTEFAYSRGQIVGAHTVPDTGDVLTALVDRLVEGGAFPQRPNQTLACRYPPGGGIGYHVDRTDIFGDIVVGLSLVIPTRFGFKPVDPDDERRVILMMEPGSLYILSGQARFTWRHGIPRKPRLYKRFRADPDAYVGQHRISLTFRDIDMDAANAVDNANSNAAEYTDAVSRDMIVPVVLPVVLPDDPTMQ